MNVSDLIDEIAQSRAAPVVGSPRTFATVPAHALAKPIAPVSYVWRHFGIAPGRPSLLAGYGGIGKTFIAQALALHVAAGVGEVFGLPIASGPVAHVDYEMTLYPVQRRYQRQAAGHGLELARCDLVVSSMPAVYLSDDDAEQLLVELVVGKVLCVVDNLAASIATSKDTEENKSSVRKYLDRLTRVTAKTGCTFLVLVHERKAGKDEPGGLQRVRGSSGITDAAGAVVSVSAGEGDGVLSLTQTKASLRKAGDELLLKLVDVGEVDADGESSGLLVSRVEERGHDERDKRLEAKVLDLLTHGSQPTRKHIEAALRARKDGSVGRAVDALALRGEIVSLPRRGYVIDSPVARLERVLRAVQAAPLATVAQVARDAHVDAQSVHDAIAAGAIAKDASERFIAPGAPAR